MKTLNSNRGMCNKLAECNPPGFVRCGTVPNKTKNSVHANNSFLFKRHFSEMANLYLLKYTWFSTIHIISSRGLVAGEH